MIRRIGCHCQTLVNIDESKEDKSGWLFYKLKTENGERWCGLCPRCQAAIKCYMDNNPINKKDKEKEKPLSAKPTPKKRGRPRKKKE